MVTRPELNEALWLLRGSVEDGIGAIFSTLAVNDIEFREYPAVRKSVLNFGVPSVHGRFWESTDDRSYDIDGLLMSIRTAIVSFEPRLVLHEVRQATREESGRFPGRDGQTSIGIVVSGQLRDRSLFEVRGLVDLVTGIVELV